MRNTPKTNHKTARNVCQKEVGVFKKKKPLFVRSRFKLLVEAIGCWFLGQTA
jgi:hypothetical protein